MFIFSLAGEQDQFEDGFIFETMEKLDQSLKETYPNMKIEIIQRGNRPAIVIVKELGTVGIIEEKDFHYGKMKIPSRFK